MPFGIYNTIMKNTLPKFSSADELDKLVDAFFKQLEGKKRATQKTAAERIFPDISQKELLKDTLQRFGIICQTDNTVRTVSFNSFSDIVNNIPIAKNWSNKCVDQGKQITFQLGNYAQVNHLQYKADENVLPAKFGWSQINIANQTLPASNTLFESLFGVTLNRPFYGGQIAQIKMVDNSDGSTDFMTTVEPRILIDQKLDLQKRKQSITFTDGVSNIVVNDYISTPYFYKPDAPDLPNGYGKAVCFLMIYAKSITPNWRKY